MTLEPILAIVILANVFAGISQAALFVPDLPAGSKYHLAFVTDGTRNATSELNADYDAFVTADAAKNADLEDLEWKAIAVTIDNNADTYVDVSGPVYRLDGVLIADNSRDLWDGSIDAPLNRTPGGATVDVRVFTGAGRNGKAAQCEDIGGGKWPCFLGSPDPDGQVFVGQSSASDQGWVTGQERSWASPPNAFYAISEVLTVTQTTIPGDFDDSGTVDAKDIDLLGAAVRTGSTDLKYDVNSSGAVEATDTEFMIEDILNTWSGDSNLDGEFNSSDLVFVFVFGEYEDSKTANSTWSEGDWNLDTEFNTSDLVEAFQRGGFEQGPRAAVSAVPEPSTVLSLLIGMAGLLRVSQARRSV